MSTLSNLMRTLLYRSSKEYVQRVFKGEVFYVFYRQGIFEKKAILEPVKNSNGTKLIQLLKTNSKTRFPIFLAPGEAGGFMTEEYSIRNQNPNRYFLNYNDGKIELDKQKKGSVLAIINKTLAKGEVVGVQAVRLGWMTCACKILLLFNVMTIYTRYAYNQMHASGLPSTKQEILKEKRQYDKNRAK